MPKDIIRYEGFVHTLVLVLLQMSHGLIRERVGYG